MAKKNGLTKTGTQVMGRPSYLTEGDVRGTEHLTKDDMKMPRLALAQGLSPQIIKGDAKFIKGLSVGQLFNDLTNYIYGEGPLQFTVIRADKPRGVQFAPLDQGGGILDFNVPLDDPRMQWRDDGKAPIATKFYDYILMFVGNDTEIFGEMIALSLKATGIKVARTLNALMKLRRTPSFSQRYVITTRMTTNAKGTFAVYVVQNNGDVSAETFKLTEGAYESIKDKVIDIEREAPADDDEPAM